MVMRSPCKRDKLAQIQSGAPSDFERTIVMSKPLSKFPEAKREEVARRRASATVVGLGQLSAQDFLRLKKVKSPAKKSEE